MKRPTDSPFRFRGKRPDEYPLPDLNPHMRLHYELVPPVVVAEEAPGFKGRWGDAPTPDDLTDQFFKAFEKDQYEVNIGVAGKLRLLHRIFPKRAENKLKHS